LGDTLREKVGSIERLLFAMDTPAKQGGGLLGGRVIGMKKRNTQKKKKKKKKILPQKNERGKKKQLSPGGRRGVTRNFPFSQKPKVRNSTVLTRAKGEDLPGAKRGGPNGGGRSVRW